MLTLTITHAQLMDLSEENTLDQQKALVARFRANRSHDAFEALIALSMPKVRAVVYRILLNDSDTDDITQDSFIAAYQKFDHFKGNSAFSTWVCQIAHNKALNHLRKFKRQVEYKPEMLSEFSSLSNPAKVMIREENKTTMDQAIEALEPHLRSVLIMAVVEKRDIAEVATIAGCTQATVYWRIHRARQQLKKLVKQMGN